MIRQAIDGDLPEVLRMSHAFHQASGLQFPIDELAIGRLFVALRADPNALFVATSDPGLAGMLGVMVYQHPLNSAVRVCEELMWWAPAGGALASAGIRLLHVAEQWAAEKNCRLVKMAALDAIAADRVEALYLHRGYQPLERGYVRYL